MRWEIEPFDGVAIVRMLSSRGNKQNPEFFAELIEAFDRLDRDHPHAPIVLTGFSLTGTGTITVVLTAASTVTLDNSEGAVANLVFTVGDGTDDETMVFSGSAQDIHSMKSPNSASRMRIQRRVFRILARHGTFDAPSSAGAASLGALAAEYASAVGTVGSIAVT